MTVLDLAARLGLGSVEIAENSHNLIFKDEPAGLLVDGIGDVVEVDENLVEPPPANLAPPLSEFVEAAALLDGELLIVLSADRLLTPLEDRRGTPRPTRGLETKTETTW